MEKKGLENFINKQVELEEKIVKLVGEVTENVKNANKNFASKYWTGLSKTC